MNPTGMNLKPSPSETHLFSEGVEFLFILGRREMDAIGDDHAVVNPHILLPS
jgi:hypothetical protein